METQTQPQPRILKITHDGTMTGGLLYYRVTDDTGDYAIFPAAGGAMVNLRDLPPPAAPPPEPPKVEAAEPKIYFWNLPWWDRYDDCTQCYRGDTPTEVATRCADAGMMVLLKCRHCGTLHRPLR